MDEDTAADGYAERDASVEASHQEVATAQQSDDVMRRLAVPDPPDAAAARERIAARGCGTWLRFAA